VDIKLFFTKLSALPLGLLICACSCVLTCNYLLLGVSTPTFAGAWWRDIPTIIYLAYLSGGIAITTAQVYGLIVYNLTGDPWMCRIYWGATTVSVFISICTFHSMIQSGAINAKHNSKEFVAMDSERGRLITALAELRDEKRGIVKGFIDVERLTKADEVAAGFDRRIALYEGKLRRIQDRIAKYSRTAGRDDFVSAESTYRTIAADVTIFWGLPSWVNQKIIVILTYFMLIAVAVLIDLTGTRLITFAIGGCRQRKGGREQRPFGHIDRRFDNMKSFVFGDDEQNVEPQRTGKCDDDGNPELHESYVAPDNEYIEPHNTCDEPSGEEQKIIDAYRQEKTYNGVFRSLRIGKNADTLAMIKNVLNRFGIRHGSKDNDQGAEV
jgi:hypothetical protein